MGDSPRSSPAAEGRIGDWIISRCRLARDYRRPIKSGRGDGDAPAQTRAQDAVWALHFGDRPGKWSMAMGGRTNDGPGASALGTGRTTGDQERLANLAVWHGGSA